MRLVLRLDDGWRRDDAERGGQDDGETGAAIQCE
jgi:hypothetical protein